MLVCPNCGDKVSKKLISGSNIYINTCKNCGGKILDDCIKQTDIKITDDIYADSLSYLDEVRRINNRRNLSRIEEYFKTKDIVGLEVGSATGCFMEMARARGISMIGIEPMKRSSEIARGKGLNVICGYFPDDLPKNEKYDFIIFNDVFEHIRDSEKVLLNCRLHLKKKGLLIINLPMSSGIIYTLSSLVNRLGDGSLLRRLWQMDTSSPHVFYYNKKSIHYIATKTGFYPLYPNGIRMRTYTLKSLKDRINLASIDGTIRKSVLIAAGFLGYPLIEIMPADLKTFYYTLTG